MLTKIERKNIFTLISQQDSKNYWSQNEWRPYLKRLSWGQMSNQMNLSFDLHRLLRLLSVVREWEKYARTHQRRGWRVKDLSSTKVKNNTKVLQRNVRQNQKYTASVCLNICHENTATPRVHTFSPHTNWTHFFDFHTQKIQSTEGSKYV